MEVYFHFTAELKVSQAFTFTSCLWRDSNPLPPSYQDGIHPFEPQRRDVLRASWRNRTPASRLRNEQTTTILIRRSSLGARTLQSFRVKDACALRENRGVRGARTHSNWLEASHAASNTCTSYCLGDLYAIPPGPSPRHLGLL